MARRIRCPSRAARLHALVVAIAAAGCADGAATAPEAGELQRSLAASCAAHGLALLDLVRQPIGSDLAHYSAIVRVGPGPNDRLRLHRVVREHAPWSPAPTEAAIMLLHGDFATFETSFAPPAHGGAAPPGGGLAIHLADRGIDVWGLDRRWTLAPAEGADLSGFASMGLAAEAADVRRALALARLTRGFTGAGWDRFALAGFSRGGVIAYAVAAAEARGPRAARHVSGLVPIDTYVDIPPEDEAARLAACARRDEERALLAAGEVDSPNFFFIELAGLAVTAPDDPSPLFEGVTNRQALLIAVGQTYLFFPVTPVYHLIGPVLEGDLPAGLGFASEAVVADWLAAAPPHQALVEAADTDGVWCGDEPLPGGELSAITVPIFYLGAAGGFGDHGLHTLSRTGSDDVTAHVVRLLPAEDEAEDFGHADLLFADDASELAWSPLAEWLLGEGSSGADGAGPSAPGPGNTQGSPGSTDHAESGVRWGAPRVRPRVGTNGLPAEPPQAPNEVGGLPVEMVRLSAVGRSPDAGAR